MERTALPDGAAALVVPRSVCGEKEKKKRFGEGSMLRSCNLSTRLSVSIAVFASQAIIATPLSFHRYHPQTSSSPHITILPALSQYCVQERCLLHSLPPPFPFSPPEPGTNLATCGKKTHSLRLPLAQSSIDNWITVCAGGSSSRQMEKTLCNTL